ncbi:hypothetical protein OG978_33880 [Streptomyces sp. NBC_01591]|uniref:hypothetical protein n=1 Tax=Streptomyces sp. NBC_01591 TaxID=2975888 RepID=UPI002DDC2B59|nr:hypothetical protein [Streptomyces sp. NBC_01591]WSD71953.1 hypothetical protein OG978_33880 [Streptomyces sp. NBC_01591]
MAIQVGSVEVDVIPNTQGIYQRLRDGLVPAATRAGQDAGNAAGRAFGPAMQSEIGSIGLRIGQQIGQQIAARIVAEIRGALRDGVTQGGAAARASAVRQGDQTGGAFSRALKTRLEAAFRALPKINIDADTTEADADLQALRVRMETLAGKRIGIDIDAEAAKAEIRLIEAELTRLGARHPNVQVRADTTTALGELAAVRAAIDGVDGKRARIDVDTSGALSAVLQLGVAIGGLAAIPAIPVLAAGIGSIGSAAVAAAVGVGALAAVAAPAIVGIAGALQAQKAAQDAATASSLKGAQASGRGASMALQMAGAQQALATAERNGARQIAQAQKSVRDARQAAADAADQAAQRNAAAARAVQDAERSLAQSQKDAKQAQEDLTDARRQAALELEDLNSRLADAQLSQRDATLGVQEAQADLNRTMADAKSTQLDKDRAQLSYDQAVQRLKEQTTETKRLKDETAAANRAGVEGSDTVAQAQDRLAKAQQQVADRARGVRDAQAEAARTQVETARQVAQAQERVSEATANVAVAQQSAADAVASAQRQIASASQSAAGGVDQAALAQAKYQAELAKLTPAARGTFNAFVSLKSAFSDWSESLQPQVMPLFTRALIGLKNSLPGLTPFVLAAARAIGTLQDRVSAGFKSPWWQTFKQDLAGSVEPAIVGLGASFGRIFKGMAGVVQAFLPHMESISSTMQRITGRFATWGTSLKGSPEFERFLSYASAQGPVLARAIGDISSAFYQMARATAPLSGPVLTALGAVARAIADIARDLPWLIQLFYAVWVATKLWTLAMIAFNLVMNANPITLITIGIVALVAAVVYAYKNFTWFRDVVNTVWEALKTGALFVWNNILKPVFDAFVIGLKAIGTAASWLWNTILSPVFGFIGAAARILATVVLTVLITPLITAFKALAAVGMWLWTNVFGPVFGWIADKAVWLWQEKIKPVWELFKVGIGLLGAKLKELWDKYAKPVLGWIADKAIALWNDKIKPVWELFKIGIGLLGAKLKELWNSYAKPVFGWIADKAKWLWDKALKPAFDAMKKGVKAVGDSFNDAKDFIKKAWDKVQDIAKKPVRFIIEKIYNGGIVPTWNKIAGAFGAPKLKEQPLDGFARGGILPGQSTWRQGDDQLVPMRRGEGVYVSEAMRDPYERARLHAVNSAAMRGKSLSQFQGFAKGGIFDWVKGAASKTVDLASTGVSWLKDGMKASAQAGLNHVVKPLLDKIAGSASVYRDMISGIPKKMITSIIDFSGKADTKLGAEGIGGGGFKAGLKWARTQNGKAYQWGGNGNPSWDCSGLVSAVESVIRGQKPHRRWATGAFSGKTAPPGWVLNGSSPYRIGITNAGVGHTAGTLNGVNVESRGGDGVVIGSRARAWNDSLFTHHYAYKGTYDSGGYLQPGLNLAYNGTGRPEPVFTTQQANALTSMAARPSEGPAGLTAGQAVTLLVQDGPTLRAYVSDVADGRVDAGLTQVRRAIGRN